MKMMNIIGKTFWLAVVFACIYPSSAQNSKEKEQVFEEGTFVQKDDFRVQPNRNFSTGEKLTYLAHYGFINAGRGTVTMDEKLHTKNSRDCYKVDIDAKTVGVFALGMKVKDKWRSYIDAKAIMPHEFYRDISENKYQLEETSYFNHKSGKVNVYQDKKGKKKQKSYDVPTYTQDMVSGYYFLRTLSFEKMKKGDIISLDAFFEDKLYDFKVRFEGREEVKTKFGKINAFMLKPVMPDNKLFDGEDAITIWISDDANRVPLKIDISMFIGTFEVEITDYEGLAHEFNWGD